MNSDSLEGSTGDFGARKIADFGKKCVTCGLNSLKK